MKHNRTILGIGTRPFLFRQIARGAASAVLLLALSAGKAYALPAGEQITAGGADVARSGASLTVTQTTSNAAINWQAFGIAAGEAVRFIQPGASSVVLNRVVGQEASQIFGSLMSNGQVFLLNPNGVLFGAGAQVSVGGIVASTLNMSDLDFMAGRHSLTRGVIAGSVVNQAAIVAANGGYVALIAPQIRNAGSINAPGGTVAMLAGDKVTLMLDNGSLLGFTIDQGTLNGLVENKGAIRADGGVVILTAKAMDQITRSLVNNTGIIAAGTLASRNGAIWLDASEVRNAGVIEATGGTGRGGQVSVTGEAVTLDTGSAIDVSGQAGGGLIEVGGGWQGGGSLRHATTVTIASGATLRANASGATGQGDGGTIAVWSDGITRVSGALEAMGAGSGNGGRIETSGHVLDVTGISVNASAPFGAAGTWLLDPWNLTVSAGATTATEAPAGTWTSNAGGSVVLNTNINTALNAGTSVVLQTSGTLGDGLGNGDITVSATIAKTAGADASLTLKAGGSIIVNGAISSTVGAMAVTLNSNTLGGGGYVNVGRAITTNGGALVIGGGASPLTGAAVGTSAQASGVNLAGVLSAGGGDITINGTGRNTSGSSNFGINQQAAIGTTGTGNITLNGTGAGTGPFETGVVINTDVTAGTGNISITGTSSAGGTIVSSHGVNIAGGTTSTNGSGTITIDGTAVPAAGSQNYGVLVKSVSSTATVRAADGLIRITGRNNVTASTIGNNGVYVAVNNTTQASVVSTGSGGITVLGFGGGSGTAGSNYGVYWDTANAFQSTGTSAISITGTGGDAGGSGNSNYGVNAGGALTAIGGPITMTGTGGSAGGSGGLSTGVNITAAITGAGGAISITGTGGATRGTGNSGITHTAAITNTGTGSITLNGTGGGTGTQETGVLSNASITAGTGDISVTGTASATATGSSNHGVQFRGGTTSTAGAGTITIAGTARGTSTGANTYGVSVVGGAVISAADGAVGITGTNNSSGSGGGNNGVYMENTGTIRSTGAGSISITGTPGSSSSGTNYGLFLNTVTAAAATLTLTSAGTVTSTGALAAANLLLLGAGGSHSLTNSANSVGTLAANTGNVNLAEGGDLVIGTIGGTAGVSATGTVLVNAAGNLTLASGAGVSAAGTGDALVLVSGANFINNAGSGALSAPNGRWLVYSTSPEGSTENGLTGAAGSTFPRLYDRTFASDPPSSITEPGNHLVYGAQPLLLTTAVNTVRPYGSANPGFSFTQSGFVVDDGVADNAATAGLSGGAVMTTSATGSSNVGTYVISTAPGTLASGTGYGLRFVNGMLTIDQRSITIGADNMARSYGDDNPVLAQHFVSGSLMNGDGLSGGVETAATVRSNVGAYAITQGSLSAGANYAITFSNGTLTVSPRGITITADSTTRAYGDANPPFTQALTFGSLVNGDALTGTAGTAASVLSSAGAYAITQGTVRAGANYLLRFVDGTLVVAPRPVTVSAYDQARDYGDPNPPFSYRVTSGNLVNGDALGGSPASPATAESEVGGYPITQGTVGIPGADANYKLSFNNGTLTINARAITVTANDQTKFFGNPDLAFTFFTSDLGSGAPLAGILGRTAGEEAGLYSINDFAPIGAGSSNYVISFLPATLVIDPSSNGGEANATASAERAWAIPNGFLDTAAYGSIRAICLRSDGYCAGLSTGRSSLRIFGSGIRLPEGMTADTQRTLRWPGPGDLRSSR